MASRSFNRTALILVIVGAINWGLAGFIKLDLVAALFGGMESWLSGIIYVIIGFAGLYFLSLFGKLSSNHRNDDAYQRQL